MVEWQAGGQDPTAAPSRPWRRNTTSALSAGGRARAGSMLLIAALLAGCFGGSAAATVRELRIEDPRDFGWFIGDLMTRTVHVQVTPGFSLDRAALPVPGEVTHWLELAERRVSGGGQRWRVDLVYRLTNTPPEDGVRVLPGFEVVTFAGTRRVPTNIPELRFTQSPVVPAEALEFLSTADVRADRPPSPAPRSAHLVRTVMLSLAILVLALYLFYCHFGAAWLARWRRPFTAALRDMRRDLGAGWGPAEERRGLERFHAAVNEAAGHVVLEEDVDRWLRECPLYAAEREDILELFRRSRQLFFDSGPRASAAVDRDRLVGLCRRLSVLELSTP